MKIHQRILPQIIFQAQFYCQICGKPNHPAENWYWYDFAHNEEKVPQALDGMSINEVPYPNWYTDTGGYNAHDQLSR